jgi:hypothetical protein
VMYASDQYYPSSEFPVEDLMLEVMALVMRGGQVDDPEVVSGYLRVEAFLAKHDLGKLLASLDETERGEFEHDLKNLGILNRK